MGNGHTDSIEIRIPPMDKAKIRQAAAKRAFLGEASASMSDFVRDAAICAADQVLSLSNTPAGAREMVIELDADTFREIKQAAKRNGERAEVVAANSIKRAIAAEKEMCLS